MDTPIAAVIVANNRPDYLHQVIDSLTTHHRDIFPTVINDGNHYGMASNVQAAWDYFLTTDAQFLLHLEDDMVIEVPLPLAASVWILRHDPWLANIVYKRHPWSSEEHEAGDVITATTAHATVVRDEPDYTVHDWIFSLNPCLIPRQVVEHGYSIGNEAGMTQKLKDLGYQFAFYGHAGDEPLIRHIGQDRGPEWRL